MKQQRFWLKASLKARLKLIWLWPMAAALLSVPLRWLRVSDIRLSWQRLEELYEKFKLEVFKPTELMKKGDIKV